jgi:hypothetical protein
LAEAFEDFGVQVVAVGVEPEAEATAHVLETHAGKTRDGPRTRLNAAQHLAARFAERLPLDLNLDALTP